MSNIFEHTADNIEKLLKLMLSFRLYRQVKMIFAMTSGLGMYLPSRYWHLHEYFSLMYAIYQCRFTIFEESEAKLYIQYFKHNCSMSINIIKSLTNFNPYYLSRINESQSEHENKGRIKAEVSTHFMELVKNIDQNDLCSFMLPKLEGAQKWFYKASNGIPLSQEEYEEFLGSWTYAQHLCDYTKREEEWVLIYPLPLSEAKLIHELAKVKKSYTLPQNPVVDGYVFEEQMFVLLNNTKSLEIFTYVPMSFSLSYVCKQNTVLEHMDKSVLYFLRYKHPVVDAVGILQDEKCVWWLVFLQISLSSYLSHRTKVTDLLEQHRCPEINSSCETLYGYYKRMCEVDVSAIYVYISPREIYKGSEGKKIILRRSKSEIQYGTIAKESSMAKDLDTICAKIKCA